MFFIFDFGTISLNLILHESYSRKIKCIWVDHNERSHFILEAQHLFCTSEIRERGWVGINQGDLKTCTLMQRLADE